MDWKGTVDRKKNCMKLFAVLQDIFSGALAESDLVTASEDMEYKLMVTHESLEKFERDLTRVYSRLKRMRKTRSAKNAKVSLKEIMDLIGSPFKMKSFPSPVALPTSAPAKHRRNGGGLSLQLDDTELAEIEMEATAPISSSSSNTTSKRKRGERKTGKPSRSIGYVPVDKATKLAKIKQLTKNNRYLSYYNEISSRYLPKLRTILDDIVSRSRSESTKLKVRNHFKGLVSFLRGDGDPVTPQSVYDAKERLKRLFYWYQENLVGRMIATGQMSEASTRAENAAPKDDDEKKTVTMATGKGTDEGARKSEDRDAKRQRTAAQQRMRSSEKMMSMLDEIKSSMNDATGKEAELGIGRFDSQNLTLGLPSLREDVVDSDAKSKTKKKDAQGSTASSSDGGESTKKEEG